MIKKIFEGVYHKNTISSLNVEKLKHLEGKFCRILMECNIPNSRNIQGATMKVSNHARDRFREYCRQEGITYDEGIENFMDQCDAFKANVEDLTDYLPRILI
ncbi:MAG: hypothetical protein D4R45_03260 [Planctomycetaceae bacterium]|nr:MAG: hypothetical protein D4R45_03260 [Planctomycetaceae bacterium]